MRTMMARTAWRALAALHLLLAAGAVLHLRPFPPGSLAEGLLQAHAQWSGVSARYGLFSPTVRPTVRVSFDVGLEPGRRVRDDLPFASDVVNQRVHSPRSTVALSDVQADLARDWATVMFSRHPDARSVSVMVDELYLPAMEDYRVGSRPMWAVVYRAEMPRRDPQPRADAP
ncbi:hypothetical protein KRR26_11590 [Corallococcus sp. M34]|uniref:hypothetical protein n=1 Tax=Citreicoccus inhibens TaxID=2849499 RepID=UPI0011C3467E|nr:hypothetical protein [Citreicoccus inhibens]MBU8896253.1 hypothetical protein [Citreicoccus inhibens]